jgi:hypothetical protein
LFLPVDDDFHCNDFRNYRTKEQAQATWGQPRAAVPTWPA